MRPIFYIILVLAIATGAYFWISSNEKKNNSDPNSNTVTEQPTEDPYKGWKVYSNEEYGVELRYPRSWNLNAEKLGVMFLDFDFSGKKLGSISISPVHDDYGKEMPGPIISDENIEIDKIVARKRVAVGDYNGSTAEIREVVIEFEESGNFYYLIMQSSNADQDLWSDFDLFIQSIKFLEE